MAFRLHLQNLFAVYRGLRAIELLPICSRISNPGANPLSRQIALKLRDRRHNGKKAPDPWDTEKRGCTTASFQAMSKFSRAAPCVPAFRREVAAASATQRVCRCKDFKNEFLERLLLATEVTSPLRCSCSMR